jgi:hypothetical protein
VIRPRTLFTKLSFSFEHLEQKKDTTLNCTAKMKILCLHGYGTNAAVLGNQLQVFLSIADKEIEPFYLEGEIEAPKAASKFSVQTLS